MRREERDETGKHKDFEPERDLRKDYKSNKSKAYWGGKDTTWDWWRDGRWWLGKKQKKKFEFEDLRIKLEGFGDEEEFQTDKISH